MKPETWRYKQLQRTEKENKHHTIAELNEIALAENLIQIEMKMAINLILSLEASKKERLQ